jgi:hypothetical protein
MSGVIHGKFHLDVIFLVGIFFSIREPPGQLPDIDDTPIPPMTDIEITSPGVEKLLQNLNPNKAAGPLRTFLRSRWFIIWLNTMCSMVLQSMHVKDTGR